ncbi:LOW QUALITY PROTEIN: hypothetical protein ACHAW6_010999 [Cyclotella cf. meneghiniana]
MDWNEVFHFSEPLHFVLFGIDVFIHVPQHCPMRKIDLCIYHILTEKSFTGSGNANVGICTPIHPGNVCLPSPHGNSGQISVLTQTLLHAMWNQAVVVAVDHRHYRKMVSPAWNIFFYNAQARGDELYDVKSLLYYIKNLAWNFNLTEALGLFSLPILFSSCRSENSATNSTNLPKQMISPKGPPASRSWG